MQLLHHFVFIAVTNKESRIEINYIEFLAQCAELYSNEVMCFCIDTLLSTSKQVPDN
jgi:hypothetical protein